MGASNLSVSTPIPASSSLRSDRTALNVLEDSKSRRICSLHCSGNGFESGPKPTTCCRNSRRMCALNSRISQYAMYDWVSKLSFVEILRETLLSAIFDRVQVEILVSDLEEADRVATSVSRSRNLCACRSEAASSALASGTDPPPSCYPPC